MQFDIEWTFGNSILDTHIMLMDRIVASNWLNMVEIEIGNMNRQCLDRRIASMDLLKSELAAWENQRNREKASINWLFDVDKARTKLHRAYDSLTGQN